MRNFTYHERQFIKTLDDECVRFLIVGSWAPALHGVSVNPRDLDVLIGMDADNVQAFLRVWDLVEPVPYRRTLRGAPGPRQQDSVTLGTNHGDVLTSVDGVDFTEAWERREMRTLADLQVPVLARVDLIAALESSERPQDRDRLALFQRHL